MAASQSFIPPISAQVPINVFSTSMPISDPVGQAGAVVPSNQQIQHPAMSMQLTDIITNATPPQTQPVMISQHYIVPQQQIGMDVQTSTVQQQPQKQMEAQVTLNEHICAIQLPLGQDQQSLSASAIQKRQLEPEQQTFVQQPVQHVQSASQQHVMATQTAVAVPQQPAEQPHVFNQQLYVQQQFDQQQQTVLRQQEQQAQLQHKNLMDQQQQGPVQQEQSAHAYLHQIEHQQQQQHFPLQQQQQSQSYQQTGLHQSRTKTMADVQQQSEEQQQKNVLLLQSQQTQQKNEQLQQQNATQWTEQQLLIQDLQKQFVLKLQQVQQKAQLQQQEQQQVQLKQHLEQQHQVLLQIQLEQQHQQVLLQQRQADLIQQQAQMKHQEQQQQQVVNIQPPQIEKHEPVHVPQSSSELQVQQQTTNLQQLCVPQLNTCQFTQQQQSVAQQQHHTSMIKPHLSVDVPGGPETVQHQTQVPVIAPPQVPVTFQTTQIPCQTSPVVLTQQGQVHPQKQEQFLVQFLAPSVPQSPQPSAEADVTSPAAVLQRQMQVYQTQQVPLQANCPGPVTPTQGQVQPLIQTQPLHTHILQSQQIPGQVPTVDIQMIGQLNQNTAQPLAAVASVFSPIHDETCVQQNVQMPSLIQSHLQQEAQGQSPYQVHPQPTAGFLTPQYVPLSSHQSMPSLLHDKAHISQQQLHQQQTLQYQPIILSPGSTGNAETKTSGLAVDPTHLLATPHPMQIGQGEASSQTTLHPVVQAQQQSTRSSVDSSFIQPMSQSLMSQSIEQYQQQLQNLSQVQPPAQLTTQPQLLAKPIQVPIPQPSPVRQDLTTPNNERQVPPQCPTTSPMVIQPSAPIGASNVAEVQSQSSTLPFYSPLMAAGPPSPQHQSKQMLPAHTHTQMSNKAQTHSQTQTQVHSTAVPAQQMALISLNTSCSSAPPPSLPSHHPTLAPATEFPTSPPVAQVALKRQAEFIPTSPSPFVTALQPLGSNVPNLPQALLQDCDISLQGVNQVHGIQKVFSTNNFYSDLLV